ncbi:M14 family zinc carboxypeptidase [Marinobacter sp.]|uniref:M14 family zinc carboxypeptidase n=1 Tax=Marinobacter sp. TaxID=50741 RepID=UPI003A937CC1
MTELRALTHIKVIPEQQNLRDAKQRRLLRRRLPELIELERILAESPQPFSAQVTGTVPVGALDLPIYRVEVRGAPADQPALLLVGGVHGLERIGTQVVLAWLRNLANRLRWDEHLAERLKHVRLVVVPMLNPGGMYLNRRSNPSGVDLMRNAPIQAQGQSSFLVGGQRISPLLPWYRGKLNQKMEPENLALQRIIDDVLPGRPFSISLDCHSGFGWRDQIWFPYAYRRRPMRNISSIMALKLLWEQSYPHHDYQFEPQSEHYVTHGDLWDYFYKRHNRRTSAPWLPLTLEMGSWRWLRKSPRQAFSREGLFNPLVAHRHQRVLRSHLILLDFLLDACANYGHWVPNSSEGEWLRAAARTHWYSKDETL